MRNGQSSSDRSYLKGEDINLKLGWTMMKYPDTPSLAALWETPIIHKSLGL